MNTINNNLKKIESDLKLVNNNFNYYARNY